MRVEPFCRRFSPMCRLCVAGVVQPEGVQFVVEGGLAESQQLGGLALVAAGLPQGAQDALLLLRLRPGCSHAVLPLSGFFPIVFLFH